MGLALASSWLAEADRLAAAAEAAHGMGFRSVFAAAPPRDAAAARPLLERLALRVAGVAAPSVGEPSGIPAAVAAAAPSAAALRRPLVVVDLGDLRPPASGPAEAAVEAVCRALHGALRAWPGLAVAVRTAGAQGRLVAAREAQWILDDLAGHPIGLWLDPPRLLALARAGAGPALLDAADRLGRRALGVAVHGLGDGRGHARPEEPGLDWGTLRDLVPASAARVLDLGPWVPPEEVVDARRHFEEALGW